MTPQTLTTDAVPRQPGLPAEPTPFIGRERDRADVSRLLSQTRAVTLCGPGGIGKTRLALQVARALADEHPDGVWLVELADVTADGSDPDTVARRVAAACGIAGEHGRAPLDTLAAALRPRRALVVLDNCEHLVEECAELCRTLLTRCERLRILATSREPLRVPGENVWRVPPLSVPSAGEPDPGRHEAVRLFLARATAARPDFALTEGNTAALVRVCRALDGVPLALELAAARVRVLSLEQIADRLADRFRLLTAGDRTAPPRQRTLRGAIDWSHELLSDPERILLRRLSVFRGWTLDQAERVCADGLLPPEGILDLLTALVDKSLVVMDREVAGESRFRLLDSIREYAAQRLAEAGEEGELRDRHRAAVLAALEHDAEIGVGARPASWRQRVAVFQRYDAEQHNLGAALAWCRERGDIDEGLRLCLAARLYWGSCGHYAEAVRWIERFLERADEASPGLVGGALVMRSLVAFDLREYDRAEEWARDGVERCRAFGGGPMLSAGLSVLGQVALRRGDERRALDLLDEALAVARAAGDRWNEALVLYARSAALRRRGLLREAEGPARAGVRIMRELDHLWGVALGQTVLGRLAWSRGDLGGARRRFEEALRPLREIDARPAIIRCLLGLARCALGQGDLEAARRMLAESLRLGMAVGLRITVARGLESCAELRMREGDERTAVLVAAAATALREVIGVPPRPDGDAAARLEGVVEQARRRLGRQAVAQLWGEGLAMSAEEAVACALAAPDAAPAGPPPAPAAPVTPPGMLTPRELEIARMVARGLSNRGIAAELVISPATVARHVTNILTKLGFGSRAQIAAWAVDNLAAGR
ncbi:ATP-binding protein [Thermomonospora amylolytica]|uniref:ATP-binding protein n=1 Tax=Thermomonospora amylolytica TaxID=1411117 RepID=UPI000E6C808C|nr:LuxR C-terminal-related transcriptional regulator [Thermomonospora amylolytica]